jgi:hypothetical protein
VSSRSRRPSPAGFHLPMRSGWYNAARCVMRRRAEIETARQRSLGEAGGPPIGVLLDRACKLYPWQ